MSTSLALDYKWVWTVNLPEIFKSVSENEEKKVSELDNELLVKEQGCIHGVISRVLLGRGSNISDSLQR